MTYILATSRPWNEMLSKRLEAKTGRPFRLITRKEELTLDRLAQLNPRYIFFPHWSYIIPKEIFEAYECVVFHMTDLPYGRGGSPLQNLILRGHRETKISALHCVAELDAGPIYMKRPLTLEGSAFEIFHRAADVIEVMIEEIVHTEPYPKIQVGEPTIFRRRTPVQSDLNKANIPNLNAFHDFIRMLDAIGYQKAFLDLHGHRIELSLAQLDRGKLTGKFEISPKNADTQ
jgi:methionyl-tRNA formyltransferase